MKINLNRFASLISGVFSPPLSLSYGFLAVGFFEVAENSLFWAFLSILLFIIPSILLVCFLVKKGSISEFHMNTREERIKPLLGGLVITIIGILILHLMQSPQIFILLGICSLLSTLSMIIITSFWKISAHSMGIAGLSSIFLFQLSSFSLLLFIPIVIWSRIRLSQHTVLQTILGTIAGFTCFGIPLFLAKN